MSSPQVANSPSQSWTEGQKLSLKDGRELNRWGGVANACKVLDDCDRHVIYELIEAGAIVAYKLQPHRANSHWKIDLLSVWTHKQNQIQGAL